MFTDCIILQAYLNVNTAVQTCCALLVWQLVYVTKRQQTNMRLLSPTMTRLTLSPPVWEQDDFRWREGVTYRKLSTPLRKDKLTLTSQLFPYLIRLLFHQQYCYAHLYSFSKVASFFCIGFCVEYIIARSRLNPYIFVIFNQTFVFLVL